MNKFIQILSLVVIATTLQALLSHHISKVFIILSFYEER